MDHYLLLKCIVEVGITIKINCDYTVTLQKGKEERCADFRVFENVIYTALELAPENCKLSRMLKPATVNSQGIVTLRDYQRNIRFTNQSLAESFARWYNERSRK